MENTAILSLFYIFPLQFYSLQFVFSQAIYEDESKFQGPFTKNLKSSVCAENVQKCGIRLHQSQAVQQNMSDELSEYKSKLMELKVVQKGFLSWTVQDLCRNIKHFIFEDLELCPFYYDCSQKNSYLQRCPVPQMFSDINLKCQDPSTVNCGSRYIPDGHMCDFEKNDESSCFLVNSNSDTFDWTRNTGSTSSSNTGPSSAYHGKYYAYIETSSPRKSGDNAVLESNKIFQDRTYCLNLFYHMYGSDIGNLIIKTKSDYVQTVLKKISGDQGYNWKRMSSLDITLNENTKVLIEATRGKDFKGDISIDLVTLSPRKC
ncbi:MAM and LDL-receptor class A domain-containing protein 1-like [Saccostrea echinata]|uniref:MAM and LDL-receptor class A domain-containing protein 1-like n=1 Tax=Saccostrea echinata TaxID=191078 RepID=UPI002A83903F|nr:MAM and LDL-receptor class A domain-containing protein 1-like [Saccostrea echinata]